MQDDLIRNMTDGHAEGYQMLGREKYSKLPFRERMAESYKALKAMGSVPSWILEDIKSGSGPLHTQARNIGKSIRGEASRYYDKKYGHSNPLSAEELARKAAGEDSGPTYEKYLREAIQRGQPSSVGPVRLKLPPEYE